MGFKDAAFTVFKWIYAIFICIWIFSLLHWVATSKPKIPVQQSPEEVQFAYGCFFLALTFIGCFLYFSDDLLEIFLE